MIWSLPGVGGGLNYAVGEVMSGRAGGAGVDLSLFAFFFFFTVEWFVVGSNKKRFVLILHLLRIWNVLKKKISPEFDSCFGSRVLKEFVVEWMMCRRRKEVLEFTIEKKKKEKKILVCDDRCENGVRYEHVLVIKMLW